MRRQRQRGERPRERQIADIVTGIEGIDIHEGTFGIVGYLLGATLSLREAIALGYAPRAVRAHGAPAYERELTRVLRDLANDPPVGPWLAGFRFNNALHRIAACADRITDVVEPPRDGGPRHARRRRRVFGNGAVVRVCEEVNLLKHEFTGRTRRGDRPVTVGDALQALREVVDVARTRWGRSSVAVSV